MAVPRLLRKALGGHSLRKESPGALGRCDTVIVGFSLYDRRDHGIWDEEET